MNSVEKLAKQLKNIELQVQSFSTPQLAFSSIEDGAIDEYDADGMFVSSIGAQFDGTHTTVSFNGPIPPIPSAPSCVTTPGVLTVHWNGKFAADAVSPMDFKHVAVHVSTDPGFVPGPENQEATIRGELGDIATLTLAAGTYYVGLVAWSTSGKASALSSVVEVAVVAPMDEAAYNQRMTDAESDISTLETVTIPDLDASLTDARTRLATAETELNAAEADIATLNDTTIPSLDSDLTAAEGRISTAEADLLTKLPAILKATGSYTFTNVAAYSEAGTSLPGYIVFDTPIEFDNYMCSLDIEGFNYQSSTSEVRAATSFYAYSTGAIINSTATSTGSAPVQIKIGRRISTGKAAVIVSRKDLADWAYPKLVVTKAIIGHINPPDSYKDGWVGRRVADLVDYDLVTTPSARDIGDTHDLAQGWRATGTVEIDGGKLKADTVTALQILGQTITAAEIETGALTSASGIFGTVDASILNAGTLNAARLNAADVRAKFIEAGKVTATDMVAGTLTSASGVFGTMDASVINAGTVAADRLDAATIRAKFLAAGKIVAGDLVAGTLTSASGAFGTMDASVINAGVIGVDRIGARTITLEKLIASGSASIIPNGQGQFGALGGWINDSSVTYDTTELPSDPSVMGSFRSAPGSGKVQSGSVTWDLDPDTDYHYELWIKADLPNSHIYIEHRDQANAHAHSPIYLLENYAVPTAWTKVTGTVRTSTSALQGKIGAIYYNHANGTEQGATIWLAGLRFQRKTSSVLIEDGAVSGGKLSFDAINGKTITGALFQTEDSAGAGLKIDTLGFRLYPPLEEGVEPGDPIIEMTADGIKNLSVTDPATGATMASMGADGKIAGKSLNSAEDIMVEGRPLMGAYMAHEHPADPDKVDGSWLGTAPRGMVAYGFRDFGSYTTGHDHVGFMELSVNLEDYRAYMVNIEPFHVLVNDSITTARLAVHYTTDGTAPTAASPKLDRFVASRIMTSSSAIQDIGSTSFLYGTGVGAAGTVLRLLFCLESSAPLSTIGTTGYSRLRVQVYDMGSGVPSSSINRASYGTKFSDGSEGGTDTPVVKKNYTKTYVSTDSRSYKGDGSHYTYADGKNRMYQGQNLASNGTLQSISTFGSMTSDLSGATITSMRAYFYFDHWYSSAGGTAQLVLHGASTLPATRPTLTLAGSKSGVSKPGGVWINIPSSRWDGFKSGTYRGVGLGHGTTGSTYYGFARASATKIEVKYSK